MDSISKRNAKASYFYLSSGRILLVGDTLETRDYCHNALKIVLAMDNNPFAIRQQHKTSLAKVAIIKPESPHFIDLHGAWRALLLIHPESEQARIIADKYLSNTTPFATPNWASVLVGLFCHRTRSLLAYYRSLLTLTNTSGMPLY